MKNIIIFGFGEMGKKLTDECLIYGTDFNIKAIADNNPKVSKYKNIPVIIPQLINKFVYDEIWVCTIYFEDIMKQLSDEYGVKEDKMHFVEPVLPILEERLRKRYEIQMSNLELVSGELKTVLTYLKNNPLRMYCYSFYNEYLHKKPQVQFDAAKGLYYGIYNGKKMYFSGKLNTHQKAMAYFNAVTMEQDSRSPHCYWKNENINHISGIGIDAGAAEGVFALRIIEQIEHIYLVEADVQWGEALKYTFEPYQDRVTIIRKFVGIDDAGDNARLDTLICSKKIDFMKLDIEGMELDALQGAEKILLDNRVQLAVCVYHHQRDNELISQWLQERGYHLQNSYGLVVCQGDWELEKDETDFRKALLFADNYTGKVNEQYGK